MATISQKAERQSFASPDETRPFSKGKVEMMRIGNTMIGRGTFEPGWKWAECVKPIAQADSCEASHLSYVISGWMRVVMDDGLQLEFGSGDALSLSPGHDAWIMGSDACVIVDFADLEDYAKPA